MANWCENHISLRGNRNEIERFGSDLLDLRAAGATRLAGSVLLERLQVRLPEAVRSALAEDMSRLIDDEIVGARQRSSAGTSTCELEFRSEWSPCEQLPIALAVLYPALQIDFGYCEMGQGFAGAMRFSSGLLQGEAFAFRDLDRLGEIVDHYYPAQLDWVRSCRTDALSWDGDFIARALGLGASWHAATGALAQELGWSAPRCT